MNSEEKVTHGGVCVPTAVVDNGSIEAFHWFKTLQCLFPAGIGIAG